jgi:hypothetical protein
MILQTLELSTTSEKVRMSMSFATSTSKGKFDDRSSLICRKTCGSNAGAGGGVGFCGRVGSTMKKLYRQL